MLGDESNLYCYQTLVGVIRAVWQSQLWALAWLGLWQPYRIHNGPLGWQGHRAELAGAGPNEEARQTSLS